MEICRESWIYPKLDLYKKCSICKDTWTYQKKQELGRKFLNLECFNN